MNESMNPRLFNNCRGRNFLHHYGTSDAFFDLNRFGLQERMALDLKPGEVCIVATQNDERTIATFQAYVLDRERDDKHDKDGQPTRVQYGRKKGKPTSMPKSKAAKSAKFCAFFRKVGKKWHFRRRSVV